MTSKIDGFIDLGNSAAPEADLDRIVARWAEVDGVGNVARQVTCVVPPGRRPEPRPGLGGWHFTDFTSRIDALTQAFERAGRDGVPLLLLLGPVKASVEAIDVLGKSLEADPMFGFALARVGCGQGCCIAGLTPRGLGHSQWLPRRVLVDMPDVEIIAEAVAPCVLIRPEILTEFGPLHAGFEHVAGALLSYMAEARRCGFRGLLCNRAIVSVDGQDCSERVALARVSEQDEALLREQVPDLERSWHEFRAGSWERFEKLSAAVIRTPRSVARPSIALDARNVGCVYNGTTYAALGIADGFKLLEPAWDISLLANPKAAEFHDLERAYPEWPVYTTLPNRAFTAALQLSQPWHIQNMVDVHSLSLFNAVLMLDTIAWDVVYAAAPYLEGTWRFVADHADALLFDSEFTRQRFVTRFPLEPGRDVPTFVSYLSFDPEEHVRSDVLDSRSDNEFIYVVGNHLDHKDVLPTAELVATAFPYQPIRILGPTPAGSPFTTSLASGWLAEPEVHRLYATARLVVFPSFYEGFGLPIVTALAYGRTVLARHSTLLDEIAARCSPAHGRLVAFDRRDELVELIGRALHGAELPEEPLGLALRGGPPKGWRDVARDILDFLEPLARESGRSRWISREHAVRQLFASRT